MNWILVLIIGVCSLITGVSGLILYSIKLGKDARK